MLTVSKKEISNSAFNGWLTLMPATSIASVAPIPCAVRGASNTPLCKALSQKVRKEPKAVCCAKAASQVCLT